MTEHSSRLLLHDGVSRDEIDDATAGEDCRLINVIPPSAGYPGQLIYATPDRRGFLHLIEDGRLGVVYLAATDPAGVEAIAGLGARLPHYTLPDIAELLAEDEEEPRFIRGLALAALAGVAEPPATWLAAFTRALEHPSVTWRNAALLALSYTLWDELRPLVVRLATADEEIIIRSHAERLLELLAARRS